jgi:diguanylate cyclase (GGDEF)-like protein
MLDKQTQLNVTLSILVVDDNRFSSAMIKRALKGTPYQDIRYASGGQEALDAIKEQPVNILIADWLMPEMDGLELSQKVRATDTQTEHFTYIILVTAKDGNNALNEAFDNGIDDFVNKDQLNEQLLPRIRAADRVTRLYSDLHKKNSLLKRKLLSLEKSNTVDQLTGLGNKRFALQKIKETIRYCEHRAGVVQLVMLEIHPWDSIKKQYPPAILQSLVKAVGAQLQTLARPLDVLCRIGPNQFILVTHQKSIEDCHNRSFHRFKEKLTTNRIKTPIGTLSVEVAMAIYATEITRHQISSAELLLSDCIKIMEKAKTSGQIETGI